MLLAVTNIALMGLLAYQTHEHARSTRRMLNQIAAKSVPELVYLNTTDEHAPRNPVGSEEREIIHPIGA